MRKVVIQQLESLARAGVCDIRRASPSAVPPGAAAGSLAEPRAEPAEAEPRAAVAADTPARGAGKTEPPSMECGQRVDALAAVNDRVTHCTRCRELADTRTRTVFGVGDPMARLVFLGEAPGADEDRQGEPFVGRAGQLLDKIIQACTLQRGQVYILNILKCRPPDNRTPTPTEAANCREYLMEQLEVIRPQYICCLGAVAAQNLLETTTPIGRLRGRFHDFRGIKVMATYHPAYLLRNPSAKRPTWDDMRMLMRDMGIDVPSD